MQTSGSLHYFSFLHFVPTYYIYIYTHIHVSIIISKIKIKNTLSRINTYEIIASGKIIDNQKCDSYCAKKAKKYENFKLIKFDQPNNNNLQDNRFS